MRDVMNELMKVASYFNEESDSLNTTLRKIQNEINSFDIGLEVWLDTMEIVESRKTDDKSDTATQIEYRLGYAKTHEGWCLAIRKVKFLVHWDTCANAEYSELELTRPEPLLKQSRHIRIQTLSLLPNLIAEIKKKAESAIEDIKRTKRLATA
jgi:hypothetical protein